MIITLFNLTYFIYLFNSQSNFLSYFFLLICISYIGVYLQYWLISLGGRVFANGPGDLGSIPGRVIPKTIKMLLDTSLLNTQQYKVHIMGKVEQSRERSSALPNTSPTPQCSSYWKGSLLVALDYGHQLYFMLTISLKTLWIYAWISAKVWEEFYETCYCSHSPFFLTSILSKMLYNLLSALWQELLEWSWGQCWTAVTGF